MIISYCGVCQSRAICVGDIGDTCIRTYILVCSRFLFGFLQVVGINLVWQMSMFGVNLAFFLFALFLFAFFLFAFS